MHAGREKYKWLAFLCDYQKSKLTTNRGDVAPTLQKQKSQTYIHGSGSVWRVM